MFSLKKTKMVYHVPLTKIAEVDLEGLVCASVEIATQVDDHHIIDGGDNVDDRRGGANYLEF